MAFQVSPGVQVNEIDLTNVVPAVSTSIGGYAGAFNWGPVEEIVLVSSEKELVNTFGSPTAATSKSFHTASSFLNYANALKAVRVVGTGAKNAAASEANALLVKNAAAYANATLTNAGNWIAKYPGALGNSLAVSICPSATAFTGWTYKSEFNEAPGTSSNASSLYCTNDEMHIVVVDQDGLITGTKDTILERFAFVSKASDALAQDGTSNYYVDVINNTSKYIWFANHDTNIAAVAGDSLTEGNATTPKNFGGYDSNITNSLSGGVDVLPVQANIETGYDLFADPETIDVNLLFSSEDVLSTKLIAIADARKDLVSFISPPIAATTVNSAPATAVKAWADAVTTSSSYVVMDSSALKVYDKYNDGYVWIPASGHVAGLCANTDLVADAWFSPAGLNRGTIRGVTKLAFNPTKAQRDELFKARVNPIVAMPGTGIVLFGDRTGLKKPSAFDAINVRRLFIALEKSISTAAKAQLFEFNDEFTRANFRNAVEPFLRDIQGRRGITDFKVVCDETNNTGDVIDRNEFVADIYIKPARAIRGITLNFIATRTGVSFNELTGA